MSMTAGSPAPKLKHLTKDRASQKPAKRPPTRNPMASSDRTEDFYTSPSSRYMGDMSDDHREGLNSNWDNDPDDIMFMESTV